MKDFETEKPEEENEDTNADSEVPSWASLGLDPRILAGLASLGWKEPTEIQEAGIPVALKGKNIVAKAKTGSGKTGAFCLPIIQRILTSPNSRAIIVCPSRELCAQTYQFLKILTSRCSDFISLYELGNETNESDDVIGASIVLGTPGRLVKAIKGNRLVMKDVAVLVLDEADLLFGFGHEKYLREFIKFLPGHEQILLMSATLTEQVEMIKKLTMKKHVTLKLEDASLPDENILQQYHICLNEDFEKFLVALSFLKLRIIRGKSLIFVCGTNRSYKLKLFLKQFGVGAVILSSELDAKSRQNAVLQFNKGKYDVLIANDQADIDEEIIEGDNEKSKKDKNKSKRAKDDLNEFGLSRGIDFQNVSNVINFDFPTFDNQYVHRAGRTARAGAKGRVINFTIGQEEREMLGDIAEKHQFKVEPFKFKMEEVDGLKMRAKEAFELCNKKAVRDCRAAELKQAILNSQKLQEEYFTSHENDLLALRHDAKFKKISQQNLASLPDYLIPKQIKKGMKMGIESGNGKRKRNFWKKTKSEAIQAKKLKKKEDPLNKIKIEKKK